MWKTYRIIATLPDCEKYGLISQMRRAATSIPGNIVEGYGRRHAKDKMRFYETSLTSAQELRYWYQACKKVGYVTDISEMIKLLDSTCRMLKSLIRKTPDLPTCI
jgi:four helix bundle protein